MKLFKKVLIIGMATMALGSSVAFGCDAGKMNSGDKDKILTSTESKDADAKISGASSAEGTKVDKK